MYIVQTQAFIPDTLVAICDYAGHHHWTNFSLPNSHIHRAHGTWSVINPESSQVHGFQINLFFSK